MTPNDLIAAMIERIVREFDPLRVVLFGSHARGEAGPQSDVDLLIVLPEIKDKHRTTVEILDALSDLAACKDIVVTTPDELTRRGDLVGTVLRPAIREGKILYDRC